MVPAQIEQVKRIHDTFTLLMRISKRWFVQRLQNYNLTLPQFTTLAAVAAHDRPATMSDLTELTLNDPPTMTGVIDRLVKLDMVRRTRSETDRRVVLVEATGAGIDLVNRIEGEVIGEMSTSYQSLSDTQLNNLEYLLHRLLRIHLMKYKSIDNEAGLEQEMQKLGVFEQDPIRYIKIEATETHRC
jgi:DNA-binding MarR family transcriptional regulator